MAIGCNSSDDFPPVFCREHYRMRDSSLDWLAFHDFLHILADRIHYHGWNFAFATKPE